MPGKWNTDYEFEAHLKRAMRLPLAGKEAQLRLAPRMDSSRFDPEYYRKMQPRESAVLCLFYPNESGSPRLVFMLRRAYKGAHSGQMSFPGGKSDPEDLSLVRTALRETREEIGVEVPEEKVLGALTEFYIPVSGFLVFPYVASLQRAPVFSKNEREVERLYFADFETLYDMAGNWKYFSHRYGEESVEVPYFSLEDQRIWGATAVILGELMAQFGKAEGIRSRTPIR